MVLMLLAASLLCCDAADEKTELLRDLMSVYGKDVEPPSADGATNISFELNLLCATPVSDFVSIESWTFMVSCASRPTLRQLSFPSLRGR